MTCLEVITYSMLSVIEAINDSMLFDGKNEWKTLSLIACYQLSVIEAIIDNPGISDINDKT